MRTDTLSHNTYAKQLVRAGTSALAIVSAAAILTGTAHAQSAPSSGSDAARSEEIIVTGSRVVRNGAQQPTPTTVVGIAELQAAPRADLADVLNTLPAFSGSTRPTQSTFSLSAGLTGVNALNLRSLGLNRTLVLLDGHRSVATDANGVIDVSEFPQALVSRVDVVTGGASAAYGSDAISAWSTSSSTRSSPASRARFRARSPTMATTRATRPR